MVYSLQIYILTLLNSWGVFYLLILHIEHVVRLSLPQVGVGPRSLLGGLNSLPRSVPFGIGGSMGRYPTPNLSYA